MDDRKIFIVAKIFDQQGVLPTSVRLLMRRDACREPWKHSERMGFKSLFWILLKFTLSMPHTPTLKTWRSLSIGSLSWIELRDVWPAQTTIWLLPRKISEDLPCKASEVFLQNAKNLCDTNQTLAPQGFPVWRPDNSDSKDCWFESSRAYQNALMKDAVQKTPHESVEFLHIY